MSAAGGTVGAPRAPAVAKPEIEIVGGPGGLSVAALRELWHYREVLSAFVTRHVKVKYKQAAIGIGWAVVQPLLAASLFAVFLGKLVDVPSEGAPYFVFALAGMVAWSYFSHAAGQGMESLVADQVLLRKVYFPREILPLASVAAALADLLPALGVLAAAAFAYGLWPTLAWLALPIPVLLLALAATAVALAISATNVYYRDVRYALPFVLQVGLFASPVVYPLDVVPGAWREVYAILNPVAAAIDGLRNIVLHGEWPELGITLGAFAWTLVLLFAGYALFKRLERGFADRV